MKPNLEELTKVLNKKLIDTEEDLNILKSGDNGNLNFALLIPKLIANICLLKNILSYVNGECDEIY